MIRLIAAALAALLCLPAVASAAAADWSRLMSPAEVVAGQADGAIVVDIRAPADFAAGHIAGAVNLPYPGWRGPRTNPGALIEDAELTTMLNGAGIAPGTPLVLVNPGDSPSAFGATARVYWTLKSAGFEQLAILNGGYAAWAEAGLPLTTEVSPRAPTTDAFAIAPTWAVTRDEVARVAEGESEMLLVDARPDAFFRAEAKHPAAGWAGTIEGAVNLFHESFFGQDGRLREDPEAVQALAREAGWTPGTTVVSFCNTGHWAASNWFALSEIGGLEDVRLYPESMVGWSTAFGG
ncbi:MAG: rhodanese-like domain-containing protein [Pseudomonadota bacterium]